MAAAGRGSMIGFSSIRSTTTEPGPGRLRGDEGGDGDAVQDARRRARPGRRARQRHRSRGRRDAADAADPATTRPGTRRTPTSRSCAAGPPPTSSSVRRSSSPPTPRSYVTGTTLFVDGGWTAADGRYEPSVSMTPSVCCRCECQRCLARHRPASTAADDAIDADALVEFTRELVRIPSVYDPARGLSEAPAAELVEAQMRAFGWDPRVELVDAGTAQRHRHHRRRPSRSHAVVRGPHRRRHRRRRGGVDRRSLRRRAARRPDLRARLGGHEVGRGGDAVRRRRSRPLRSVPRTDRRRRPRRRGGDDVGRPATSSPAAMPPTSMG